MPKIKKEIKQEKIDSKESKAVTAFKSIEDLFECQISANPMQKPVVTTCCGQTYDTSSLESLANCPQCRADLHYVDNRHITTIMQESSTFKKILEESERVIATTNQLLVEECKNEKAHSAELAETLQKNYEENDSLRNEKGRRTELAEALKNSKEENNSLLSALEHSRREQQLTIDAAQSNQRKWWQHPAIALTTGFIAGGAVAYLLSWHRALQLAQSSPQLANALPATNSGNMGIINPILLQELAPLAPALSPLPSSLPYYIDASAIQDFSTDLASDVDASVPTASGEQFISGVDIQPLTAEVDLSPTQDSHTPVNKLQTAQGITRPPSDIVQKLLSRAQAVLRGSKAQESDFLPREAAALITEKSRFIQAAAIYRHALANPPYHNPEALRALGKLIEQGKIKESDNMASARYLPACGDSAWMKLLDASAKEQAEFLYRYADKSENTKLRAEIQRLHTKVQHSQTRKKIWDSEKNSWQTVEFTSADAQSLENTMYGLADAIEQELIPAIAEDFATGTFVADRTPKEHAAALRQYAHDFLKQQNIVSTPPKGLNRNNLFAGQSKESSATTATTLPLNKAPRKN